MGYREALARQARLDLHALLDVAPYPEAIISAVDRGQIDGQEYDGKGGNGCVINQLATAARKARADLVAETYETSGRAVINVEQWIRHVRAGRTADSSPALKALKLWAEEWQHREDMKNPELSRAIATLLDSAKIALVSLGLMVLVR
jgi:hypothetical protein